ncbi:aspartate-semialdehyde dehydrogenase [Grimontia sp. NTOU-MAR1]|uniref:aspartate-semialdehyde dehydrogenase n=1 Tax=Grimontia sp. NTOU-MAR1 TaxID=3111011 RepID=UPI002DB6F0B1|nr:aspartate-semialdehyde dehydrogenase [Grimontia sp. NTOU-MAR1]WRV97591.1 aspartate-semialdehyde dehydrogenase [Grimontia sp. NTOU-MAR1]
MHFYESIKAISEKTLETAKQDSFAGYDPFDGLNSVFFNVFPRLKKGLFGLCWIQFNKRSLINFRPMLGVPKKRNPKGIALFILGLIEQYRHNKDDAYLQQAIQLGDWLLHQQCSKEEWGNACWGYHFDWNARAFYVPKGKPNVITTIYVSQALFALSEITHNPKYSEPALDAAAFIVNILYNDKEGQKYFSYIPGEKAFVHNASLWGAAWVAKVANLTGNDDYKQLAIDVALQSVKAQRDDGSWVYGTRHHHQFVDGFHTGYNLEALQMIKESLGVDIFDSAISKGLTYYKTHLFEEDGTAKYYNNNRYPLDMHSVSQAVFTLLRVGKTDEDIELAKKIVETSVRQLYRQGSGLFSYQKYRHIKNNTNYIRWTQAWVYYSFLFLLNYGTYHEKD